MCEFCVQNCYHPAQASSSGINRKGLKGKRPSPVGPPTTTLEPKRRDSNYHNTNDLSQIVAPSSNSANTNTDYDNLFRLKDVIIIIIHISAMFLAN